MRLLIVEDSDRLRLSLTDGLQRSGYAVDAVADGRQALIYAQTTTYDVIILDLMIPLVDGLAVLKTLREKAVNSHVLILSARDGVDQRIEGLRTGADDYLVKPFSFEELLARVEALSRRAHSKKSSRLDLGDVVVDMTKKTVEVADQLISLTPREYALLEYLAMKSGQPVARIEIEEHIYDGSQSIWSNVVDSTVSAIRRKLGAHGVEGLILTRRGLGYELCNSAVRQDTIG
jgi:DNA-binding response OmpR family regulator